MTACVAVRRSLPCGDFGPVPLARYDGWLQSVALTSPRSRSNALDGHVTRQLRALVMRQRMGFPPQQACRGLRDDAPCQPPSRLVTALMDLAMLAAAQRYGELIADLAAERSRLRKTQMMRVERTCGRRSGSAAA